MGIYSTKPLFQRALQPAVAWCAKRRLPPDLFTYGAIGSSALASVILASGAMTPGGLVSAAACYVLRLLFNLMDGQVARASKLADALGELKNEFGDRVSDGLVFGGLLFSGYVEPRLAGITLALVLGVSYLGILSKALGGPRLYGGIFGKGDRMISLAITCVLVAITGNTALLNVYLVLACALSLITLAQRLRIIVNQEAHHVHTQLTQLTQPTQLIQLTQPIQQPNVFAQPARIVHRLRPRRGAGAVLRPQKSARWPAR
jgi:CDP-diacylglycerol--glycerol-3-phosphate 3-phosphatidyltransferase